MKRLSTKSKAVVFAVTAAFGYCITAWFRHLLGAPPDPSAAGAYAIQSRAPEVIFRQQSLGADIPEEIRRKALGESARPAARRPAETQNLNYAFVIADNHADQIRGMIDEMLARPETLKQEGGITPSGLKAMAEEGRMAW